MKRIVIILMSALLLVGVAFGCAGRSESKRSESYASKADYNDFYYEPAEYEMAYEPEPYPEDAKYGGMGSVRNDGAVVQSATQGWFASRSTVSCMLSRKQARSAASRCARRSFKRCTPSIVSY